jgi:O-antigen ligase
MLASHPLDWATLGGEINPFNTVATTLSGLAVGILCVVHGRNVFPVVRRNAPCILLALLIAASSIWSVHTDLTIRRSTNYIVTMLTALYLSGRFENDSLMKVLSWSVALSAIGSFVFVAGFPDYGIMQLPGYEGDWRGVFSIKNSLGYAMSVGVFVECYILAGSIRYNWRHIFLLLIYLSLVALSGSAAALVCSLLYLLGAFAFTVWSRAPAIGFVASTALGLLGLIALVMLWTDPGEGLALLGKDATLTGRTDIWAIVPKLIAERPLLGWGYAATWQPEDDATLYVWNLVDWKPPSAHNALLEIALQLGLMGTLSVIAVLVQALWRSAACISRQAYRLGAFSLLYFLVTIYSGITEPDLAQNQRIEWLVFLLLLFRSGLEISREKLPPAGTESRLPQRAALECN